MSLSDEMALVLKLKSLEVPCGNVFEGITTFAERREKVRVLARPVREVIFTVRNGREITIEDMFILAYREDL